MNKHKKINLVSIFISAFAILFMIIGLGLLSSNVIEQKDPKGVTISSINGFGLISALESAKNMKIFDSKTNKLENMGDNGMLDIFKDKVTIMTQEINTRDMNNIGNIRCGVVFTVFITPILLLISFVGFGYNYFSFYKFYKDKN